MLEEYSYEFVLDVVEFCYTEYKFIFGISSVIYVLDVAGAPVLYHFDITCKV